MASLAFNRSRAKKTTLFLSMSLVCLATSVILFTKMLFLVKEGDGGAFFVLFCVLFIFIALVCYGFFLTFGQKIILFQKIFEHSNDAIAIADNNGNYIWQNKSHLLLFGLEIEEMQKNPATFFINSKEVQLKEELDKIKEFSGIFKSVSKNGFQDVFISAYSVVDELDDTLCYVAMKREATEYLTIIEKSKKERERILDIAHRDPLTKLLNRNGFYEQIQEKTKDYLRGSIIFADIDNFKQVNDVFGHAKGDMVIQGVGKVMCEQIRSTDLVARFGGEEFVIWIDAHQDIAYEIAEKIRIAIMEKAFDELKITISVGISQMIDNNLESAIKRADEAMYAAKRAGKNQTKYASYHLDDN